MTKRIGPQMRAVMFYVQHNPGRSMRYYANKVGPSQRFGYRTVHRVIAAKLVYTKREKHGWTLLFPKARND